MPRYDYRCLTCDDVFEQRVPIDQADSVPCPAGHAEVRRLISTFAVGRGGLSSAPVPAPGPSGGCCGGACGCG